VKKKISYAGEIQSKAINLENFTTSSIPTLAL